FFSSSRRHTRFSRDWSSDVCSSDLEHSIWLTLLRDRIRQIRPLLADDGSVWVHLDHVESHRCRVVLDEELGERNFVAEVAWQKEIGRASCRESGPTRMGAARRRAEC